jgi:hypothetical protein
MAKSGSRIIGSVDLSLKNGGGDRENRQLKSMQTYKKSLISIDMYTTFKHRVDATQLSNIPLARENFVRLNFRTNRVFPLDQ